MIPLIQRRAAPDGGTANIGGEFDEDPAVCDDCGEEISANDVSAEEFEQSAQLVCTTCADARNEKRVDDFWSGQ